MKEIETYRDVTYRYLNRLSNAELLSFRDHLKNYKHMIGLTHGNWNEFGMGSSQATECIAIINMILTKRNVSNNGKITQAEIERIVKNAIDLQQKIISQNPEANVSEGHTIAEYIYEYAFDKAIAFAIWRSLDGKN